VQSQDLRALGLYELGDIEPPVLQEHQEAGAPAPESLYPNG
jgi:hypothetical protein